MMKVMGIGMLFLVCMKASASNSTTQQQPALRIHIANRVKSLDNEIPSDNFVKLLANGEEFSNLQCSIECVTSKSCVSFFYNTKTRECRLYEGGLNTIPSPRHVQNASVHYRFNEGQIGHSCDVTEDCRVERSVCWTDGTCACSPGYSFQRYSHTCEARCDAYGATFQRKPLQTIYDNNEATFDAISVEDCLQLCVDASSFTCRSMEYEFGIKRCKLASVGLLDVPTSDLTGNYWNSRNDYYHRNCA